MCGIVGCKLRHALSEQDIKTMQSLRDMLTHRGPDGSGEYVDAASGLYLGHRRLAIIDLDERSAQPMHTERQIVSYNGEIYNYLELRKELEGEYQFKTDSDTEVLAHAWDKWGAKALLKFDGMFALSLKDKEGLHLVTDFFGEKPLYVLEKEEGVYFSSEAFPLIQLFDLKWDPDEQQHSQFMHLGYVEPPATGYKGLTSLKSGSHMIITDDLKMKVKSYWQYPIPEISKGSIRSISSKDIDQLRDLLCHSLEKRLRSDVKTGLFLSGGVDSALIAALAKKELNTDLQTYTVAFPDGADESAYAKEIANNLQIPHHIIHTQQDESWKDAPKNLLNLYGVLNDNMTALAVRSMCAASKQYLTVALTGLGGDELFYGYNKYKTLYKNRWLYQYDHFIKPIASLMPFSKIKTASALLKGSEMRRFMRLKNTSGQDVIEELNTPPLHNMLNTNISDMVHKIRFFDLISTMPQSHIPAIERGSMKESIEVRTPYLNRDLLDFVMQLDQRALIHKEKKYMLRRLLERYIDLDLLTPHKQGFVYPLSRYFSQKNIHFPVRDKIKNNYQRLALRQCLLSEAQ